MNSWYEEFERKYNQPHIDEVTVGFSGIDPQQKAEVDWDEMLSKLRIDSGNIDPNASDPAPVVTPDPSPQPSSSSKHEQLSGLLGGDNNGHYHLTQTEYQQLKILIASLFSSESETGESETQVSPAIFNITPQD